jgi:hypothetical protein
LKRFELKKKMGFTYCDSLTRPFLETYFEHGDYINFMRAIEPCDPSQDGMLGHLKNSHETMRDQLMTKIEYIKNTEADEENRSLLQNAIKISVSPRYKKAQVALDLLNILGFVWHQDQTIMSGQQLDDRWREYVHPWVIDQYYRIKALFQLQRSSKLNQNSSRAKYLGFINSILHSGLGVRICRLGEDWKQRQSFGLHMDVPLISSVGLRLRSKKGIHENMKASECLTLKRFKS